MSLVASFCESRLTALLRVRQFAIISSGSKLNSIVKVNCVDMACEKCSVDLISREPVAKCLECDLSFHVACAKGYKNRSKNWKCESCKDESESGASSIDCGDEKRHILEAINSMKKELGDKIESIHSTINSLRDDFKVLTGKVNTIEGEQVELGRRCVQLEQANAALQDETRQLRQQFQDLEQHSRCANLEILGIPGSEKENIYALLGRLAQVINVPYNIEDISIAHRLRLYSKKHTAPPIIVQFVSRTTREAWLRAARQKRALAASEVWSNFPPNAVYINEHLTGTNKELLGRARRLFREKKIHSARFVNGKVIVKPGEGETAVRVMQMSDLDCYDK